MVGIWAVEETEHHSFFCVAMFFCGTSRNFSFISLSSPSFLMTKRGGMRLGSHCEPSGNLSDW